MDDGTGRRHAEVLVDLGLDRPVRAAVDTAAPVAAGDPIFVQLANSPEYLDRTYVWSVELDAPSGLPSDVYWTPFLLGCLGLLVAGGVALTARRKRDPATWRAPSPRGPSWGSTGGAN
ncbi:MAG: hypothetical protein R2715_02845 [Ilumatobacteraceae bacterium]